MHKDTSQKDRIPKALHPEYFKVDGRSLHTLYQEARELAKAMVYYETSAEKAEGSWALFFEEADAYLQKIISGEWEAEVSDPDRAGECPPHLSLLLAFLKLFGHTQHQLNNLTASHLRFFYQKILGQEPKEVKPDQVYIFFTLARNIEKYELPESTALLAGKDQQGQNIVYTTDRSLLLTHARVAACKALLNRKASNGSIYAFPVANSADGLGTPLKEEEGWYPFGHPDIVRASASIGWGIASPMLFLQEGKRSIFLTFSLANYHDKVQALEQLEVSAFDTKLTGPERWFSKEVSDLHFQDGKLTFVIQLQETDPPVVAFDKNKHGYQIEGGDGPILTILLRKGFAYSDYAFMQSLQFTGVTIKVEVKNAHSLQVSNDFGDLDVHRDFQPFGYAPVTGSNLYLGFEETFHKPVTSLALHMKWKGIPEDFKNYYEGYPGPTNSLVSSGKDFKVKASIRYQKEWHALKNKATNDPELSLFEDTLALDTGENYREETIANLESSYEDGLVCLTLSAPSQAFGHALYPSVYARAVMSKMQKKASPIPNEPYTPTISSVKMDYTAEESLNFSQGSRAAFLFFHVAPFGINEIYWAREQTSSIATYALMSGEFHHAGSLCLGIEHLHPPQQLSVFFELEEQLLPDKPDLAFYYLTKNGWQLLSENEVLSDTTLGLKQTGILLLNLPADLKAGSTLMPGEYHWLRISVPDHPENFDRIVNIRTNAIPCTLQYDPALQGVEVNTLPPNSIKNFSRKIGAIKQIEQPYTSFGGRPAEKESQYFTRVSEKLRHKSRSITSWDMERMVLEQFPEIYKVKCIQHTDVDGQPTPACVHMIVIPFLRQYRRTKILKPLVSGTTLGKIQAFIKRYASPHAQIKVTNPVYEEIKVMAQVNFSIQVDAGFYLKQLQHDLQYFLSPWAFEEDEEIQWGSKLYRSSIIAFIESRTYVNFIASIRLLKNKREVQDDEISTDERTIIISSDTHEIEAVETDRIVCQTNQGVGQMIVDINFEVQ